MRNAGTSHVPVRAAREATVNQPGAATGVMVSRDLPSPQVEGAVYAFDATIAAGSGTYEYRYEVKGEFTGDQWLELRDYDTNSAFTWSTAGAIGGNVIRVSARNADSADEPITDNVQAGVNPPVFPIRSNKLALVFRSNTGYNNSI